MEKQRQEILNQAANLVVSEFEDQAETVLQLRNTLDLKNTDLLSDNILINRNIHKDIKKSIKEYSSDISKIIAATSYFIEESGFKSLDEVVRGIALDSRRDQKRRDDLVVAQKQIKLSYSSLSATVEVFKIVNQMLFSRVSGIEDSVVGVEGRLNKTKMLLKSSILIYELTGFVIKQLETFALNGFDDLEAIRDDVMADIESNRNSDEKLMGMIASQTEEIREKTQKSVDAREEFRKVVEKKWDGIFKDIASNRSKISKSLGIVDKLKITQLDAKNTMDILNISATTMLVANSVETINNLAQGIEGWDVPELNGRLACELLNINMEA